MAQLTITLTDERNTILNIIVARENERSGTSYTPEQYVSYMVSQVLDQRGVDIIKGRAKEIEDRYISEPDFRALIEGAIGGG